MTVRAQSRTVQLIQMPFYVSSSAVENSSVYSDAFQCQFERSREQFSLFRCISVSVRAQSRTIQLIQMPFYVSSSAVENTLLSAKLTLPFQKGGLKSTLLKSDNFICKVGLREPQHEISVVNRQFHFALAKLNYYLSLVQ